MKKPLTLAQILMLFYVHVLTINEHNKLHNPNYELSKHYLYNLKKELKLMSSSNDYMNDHIGTPIQMMNYILNNTNTFWTNGFIDEFIIYKWNTLYLTSLEWDEINICLDKSNSTIKPPFHKGQLNFF